MSITSKPSLLRSFLSLLGLLAACGGVTSASDAAMSSDGAPGIDGSPGIDGTPGADGGTDAQEGCIEANCLLGCYSDGTRCNKVDPSNGLATHLDSAETMGDVTLPSGTTVNADDGTVWSALMDCVRDDLAISKPGHDSWDGD